MEISGTVGILLPNANGSMPKGLPRNNDANGSIGIVIVGAADVEAGGAEAYT